MDWASPVPRYDCDGVAICFPSGDCRARPHGIDSTHSHIAHYVCLHVSQRHSALKRRYQGRLARRLADWRQSLRRWIVCHYEHGRGSYRRRRLERSAWRCRDMRGSSINATRILVELSNLGLGKH